MTRSHRPDRFRERSSRAGFDFAKNRAQIIPKLFNFLITIFRFLCQRAIENRLQLRGYASRPCLRQRKWLLMKNGMPNIHASLSLEWPRPCKHFVKQDAGRENICARIDSIAAGLFRRGIRCRSVGNTHFSQIGMMNSPRRLCIQKFCQSEVENLDLPMSSDDHIAGFYVAMDDAARVGGGQGVGYLNRNRKRAG